MTFNSNIFFWVAHCLFANTFHPEGHLGRIRNSVTLLSRISRNLLTRIRIHLGHNGISSNSISPFLFLRACNTTPPQFPPAISGERGSWATPSFIVLYWWGKRTPQKHPLRHSCQVVSECLSFCNCASLKIHCESMAKIEMFWYQK